MENRKFLLPLLLGYSFATDCPLDFHHFIALEPSRNKFKFSGNAVGAIINLKFLLKEDGQYFAVQETLDAARDSVP